MHTVAVESELYNRIEKTAQEQQANVDEILSQAIRRYLWELDRRKISEESKIYRQRHPELKEQYLGQYIAMHNGQVVDHDADFQTLRQRIRQRFEHTPVMITSVQEIAERPLVRQGFRVETNL
jgi:glutamyl-tRNA reductase